MPYRVDLGAGQKIYIDQMGTDTAILLASSSAGQQQQASSRYATGQWTKDPKVFLINGGRDGVAVKVVAIQGTIFVRIYQGQMSVSTEPAGQLKEAKMTYVDETPAVNLPPMQPMKPMQPMEMGNMSMNADTMEMRMGNMSIGGMPPQDNADDTSQESKKFCTQCGTAVQPEDNFCGSCGHKLK